MADWEKILSGNEEELNEEELIKYLEGNLSEKEKYDIEQKITSSPFTNDAVEGLEEFDDKENLKFYVEQLNKNLHQHLTARKTRHQKRGIKNSPWIYIAAIIILAVCIVGYFMIHMYKQNTQKSLPERHEKISTTD